MEMGSSCHRTRVDSKPHKMDHISAPAVNFYNCSGSCDRNTCSCRKNGILCSLACGKYKSITCSNVGTDDSTDAPDTWNPSG